MYSTCMFCHSPLGGNESIERFPVGRRLAFDSAKGRLWVVCRACARWNLTPIEERWEAIEECERAFRDTRLRYSTGNVGLARLREGVDLVRVGQALRPEFAAWRYGDQFGRRRRTYLLTASAGLGVTGASWVGMALSGSAPAIFVSGTALALGFGGLVAIPTLLASLWGAHRTMKDIRAQKEIVAKGSSAEGAQLSVYRRELPSVELIRGEEDRWAVRLRSGGAKHRLVDDMAVRVTALALADQNVAGASARQVSDAVATLESYHGLEQLRRGVTLYDRLGTVPSEIRLALEMALHEDAERRALEGELAELERAWQQADELATIADNLLLPAAVTDWLARHRR